MGLLDIIKGGNLFGADGDTQNANNRFAAMPMQQQMPAPQPEKRGGFLGSGYNGEDIMAMLVRAAALAQGDYGGALQAGQFIGKDKRDAAMRQAELADYEEKQRIEARYKGGPEPTTMYRQYKEAGYSDAEIENLMRQDLRAGRTKYIPLSENGSLAGIEPGQPPQMVVVPNPGGQPVGAPAAAGGGVAPFQDPATGKTYYRVGNRVFDNAAEAAAAGGGVSNGTGNFRP